MKAHLFDRLWNEAMQNRRKKRRGKRAKASRTFARLLSKSIKTMNTKWFDLNEVA